MSPIRFKEVVYCLFFYVLSIKPTLVLFRLPFANFAGMLI